MYCSARKDSTIEVAVINKAESSLELEGCRSVGAELHAGLKALKGDGVAGGGAAKAERWSVIRPHPYPGS